MRQQYLNISTLHNYRVSMTEKPTARAILGSFAQPRPSAIVLPTNEKIRENKRQAKLTSMLSIQPV